MWQWTREWIGSQSSQNTEEASLSSGSSVSSGGSSARASSVVTNPDRGARGGPGGLRAQRGEDLSSLPSPQPTAATREYGRNSVTSSSSSSGSSNSSKAIDYGNKNRRASLNRSTGSGAIDEESDAPSPAESRSNRRGVAPSIDDPFGGPIPVHMSLDPDVLDRLMRQCRADLESEKQFGIDEVDPERQIRSGYPGTADDKQRRLYIRFLLGMLRMFGIDKSCASNVSEQQFLALRKDLLGDGPAIDKMQLSFDACTIVEKRVKEVVLAWRQSQISLLSGSLFRVTLEKSDEERFVAYLAFKVVGVLTRHYHAVLHSYLDTGVRSPGHKSEPRVEHEDIEGITKKLDFTNI